MSRRSRRGATTVEMTLVGIPLIFMLISLFEISRGMWVYHTLSYAVKDGVRFALVHGVNCVTTADNPNDCATTIAAVAAIVQNAGVGLDPGTTQLTFTPGSTSGTASSCYLASPGTPLCSGLTTQWPPDTFNAVGKPVRIDITTPFLSALGMFWPGNKPVTFAPVAHLGASSLDYIQF